MTALRAGCLNIWEVLAQSIAMLGPTLTPVLIVPLMFASAGNASWLAYALGSLMLLAVALNVREFATRSSSAGSLYDYAHRAFGVRGSALCGWALIWSYAFVCIAGLTGFAVFARALAPLTHVNLAPIVALCIVLSVAMILAYRDIRLSTITMLALEAGSITLILVLFGFVLARHGSIVDPEQLHLHGGTLSGVALGTTIAIFSLVGFESATSLGEEAHDPRRTIPRAVILSVGISGAFFIFCAYVEVLGARGLASPLDKLGTPLDALADAARVPALKYAIDAGALLSSFSIALAALNAGARVVFDMGRSGVFPRALARTHPTYLTPNVALAIFGAISGIIGGGMLAGGIAPIDAFNDTATLGSFGFVAIYTFVALGAPIYLYRIGELRRRNIALSAFTLALLFVPAIGSLYPVPVPPNDRFPYIFAAYALVGAIVLWRRVRSEQVLEPDPA